MRDALLRGIVHVCMKNRENNWQYSALVECMQSLLQGFLDHHFNWLFIPVCQFALNV